MIHVSKEQSLSTLANHCTLLRKCVLRSTRALNDPLGEFEFGPIERWWRQTKTWGVSLALIVANLAFIMVIKVWQNTDEYQSVFGQGEFGFVLNQIIAIVIITVNFLLKLVNRMLMGQERHASREDEQIAMFNKVRSYVHHQHNTHADLCRLVPVLHQPSVV